MPSIVCIFFPCNIIQCEAHELWIKKQRWLSFLVFASCVILGNQLHFAKMEFPPVCKGNDQPDGIIVRIKWDKNDNHIIATQ
jgi:hypothetical protein